MNITMGAETLGEVSATMAITSASSVSFRRARAAAAWIVGPSARGSL